MNSSIKLLVNLDSHELKTLASAFTHRSLVLTNTCSEYQYVDTAHCSSVSTDVLLDAIEVRFLCYHSLWIAFCHSILYVTHVRVAAKTKYTRLLVEEIRDTVSVKTELFLDESDSATVDITRACAHHDTLKRSKTHRSIYTLAVNDSSERATVTDMSSNHLAAFLWYAEEFASALAYIAVGCAVETIATNAILLVQLVRNGIHISLRRHGLMECSVEYTNLWEVWHQLANSVYALEVCWVVERSEV